MNTAITTIIPKPTQTQVVEAMLERLKVARAEKKKRLEKEAETDTKKLELMLIADLKKKGPNKISFGAYGEGQGNCSFQVSAASKKLGFAISKKERDARDLMWLDEAKAKREIRESLKPKADILKNPDAKDAIDHMVGRIFGIRPALVLEDKAGEAE